MSDLIERLRGGVLYGDARMHNPEGHDPLRMEAADRIEALTTENERLRSALRWIEQEDYGSGVAKAARAALGEER